MDQTIHNGKPLVSVVMCAYNGLPYIKEAIADILNQTYAHWELIIADDGSNDGTREWLKDNCTDPRIRLYFNEKNLGYVANKNFGHQLAKGVFITQLDNDDRCTSDRLEKMVNTIILHPEIKIVASGYKRIDSESNEYGEVAPPTDIVLKQKPDDAYPFWFPSLFVHHTVFEQIGYFDSYFTGALGDDIYWTVKANKHYPIYCLKDALYSYRNNPNSITNDYNSVRKLIMPAVLNHLFEQQKTLGYDSLEQKNINELQELEIKLINNKHFMAEQYRIWAAKAVDKNDKKLAWKLLGKAFKNNPFNKIIFRTALYALRKN